MRIGTKAKGFRGYNLPQLIPNDDIPLFSRLRQHKVKLKLYKWDSISTVPIFIDIVIFYPIRT